MVKRTIIPRTKTVELATKSWNTMPISQKRELLKNMGHNQSFAKTKSMTELVNRGGGMVARDFHGLVKLYLQKNPNVRNVRFK